VDEKRREPVGHCGTGINIPATLLELGDDGDCRRRKEDSPLHVGGMNASWQSYMYVNMYILDKRQDIATKYVTRRGQRTITRSCMNENLEKDEKLNI